jgi:L-malate glycosyltransferase
MPTTIGFLLGTHEDWGGASRALLNFARMIDRQRFRPIVVVTRRGSLSQQLEEEGLEYMIWKVHDRGRNLLRYLADVRRAANAFHERGLQVLHSNYGSIGWKPAEILGARLRGIPIVSHLHIPADNPSSFLRYSSAVIAVSKYVADNSQTFGVPKRIIHNLANLERFGRGSDLRQELGYAPSDVIITFLGQMIRVKGLEMFADLAARVVDPRARFLLAGPLRNTQGAYTEAEIRELVARDSRLHYLGFRSDVENLYATSDIMVMPSQWEEPCAMVLFEAAAAGKPIVATATGGTAEILRHGETGFLVERHDIDGMTQCVVRLIEDQQLRIRLGETARRLARTSFAVDPVRQVEELYAFLTMPR